MSIFKINKLKNIVFFGYLNYYSELIKFNKYLKLNTQVFVPKGVKVDSKIKFKLFKNIDKNIITYLNSLDTKNTLFISLGCGYIFKKTEIKKYFNNKIVNFHNSRLPFNKGRAYVSWQILNQDRIFNSAIHLLNENIDDGGIICENASVIPSNLTTPKQIQKYDDYQTIVLYKKFITKLKNKKTFKISRNSKNIGSYNYPLNTDMHGFINWNLSALDLKNFITAFDEPYKGASSFLNSNINERLYIKKAQLHGGEFYNNSFSSGTVIRNNKNWLVVACTGNFSILIEEILNKKGENILPSIKPGHRFVTPEKYILKTYARVKY